MLKLKLEEEEEISARALKEARALKKENFLLQKQNEKDLEQHQQEKIAFNDALEIGMFM